MATDDILSSDLDPLDPLTELDPLDDPLADVELDSEQLAEVTAEAEADEDDDEEFEESLHHHSFILRNTLRGIGACGFSIIVHVIALVLLAVMTFDKATEAASQMLMVSAPQEEIEDPPVEIELQEEIEKVTEQTVSVFSAAPAVGIAGGGPVAAGSPTLDMTLVEKADTTEIHIDAPTIGMPDSTKLIEAVPDGEVKGEPRDIVDNYQTAMDRIAQEIMWMLDKGPVLVVWAFDQSESMKDDQQEIRDRVGNVYNQLGIVGDQHNDALLTAVTSYGKGFLDHTNKKPTSKRDEIRQAIDSVPIDDSGEEMMCQAVGRAITLYRDTARRGRQMCLILVTDESGNRQNNNKFLEQAIAAAKSVGCKIYVLGRSRSSVTHTLTFAGSTRRRIASIGCRSIAAPKRLSRNNYKPTGFAAATMRSAAALGLMNKHAWHAKQMASSSCCPVSRQTSSEPKRRGTRSKPCGRTDLTCGRGKRSLLIAISIRCGA